MFKVLRTNYIDQTLLIRFFSHVVRKPYLVPSVNPTANRSRYSQSPLPDRIRAADPDHCQNPGYAVM
jgi:hypothetical protein